jgi:Rap1a immunity proteins
MRLKSWLIASGFGIAACVGTARAAVTEDDFLLRNTGDLVDVCTATQADPMYTAAVNFCQGFGVGVFRVLQEEDMARRSRHLFCLPNPPPTRNEGLAAFVQWAKADASRMSQPAADGIAAFLADQYKCPKGR